MGFWGSLTGSNQRRNIRDGMYQTELQLRKGRDYAEQYGSQARNYLMPYYQGGQQGYNMYLNAIGANGNEAQQGYWDNYQSDPQRAYDEGRAVQAVTRQNAARGLSNSGYNALAGARASMDMGRQYTQDRLNRLQGLGAQGMQAGMGMASIDQNIADQLVRLQMASAQNQQAGAQGLAAAQNIGPQNLMNGINTGLKLFGMF